MDVLSSQSLGSLLKNNLNLTQQKYKHASVTKYTIIQNKHTQTSKARFRRLLRPPAWKRDGPVPNEVIKTSKEMSKEERQEVDSGAEPNV